MKVLVSKYLAYPQWIILKDFLTFDIHRALAFSCCIMLMKDAASGFPNIAFFWRIQFFFIFFIFFTAGGASIVRKNMSEMLTGYSKRYRKITLTYLRMSLKVLLSPSFVCFVCFFVCFECSFWPYCGNIAGAYLWVWLVWTMQCYPGCRGVVTNLKQTHYPALIVVSLSMPSMNVKLFSFSQMSPQTYY